MQLWRAARNLAKGIFPSNLVAWLILYSTDRSLARHLPLWKHLLDILRWKTKMGIAAKRNSCRGQCLSYGGRSAGKCTRATQPLCVFEYPSLPSADVVAAGEGLSRTAKVSSHLQESLQLSCYYSLFYRNSIFRFVAEKYILAFLQPSSARLPKTGVVPGRLCVFHSAHTVAVLHLQPCLAMTEDAQVVTVSLRRSSQDERRSAGFSRIMDDAQMHPS
mmetsp:Transcript_77072/g.121715  ORF Transcript_77072/g.121715 Transcript_77072/m.121715 type:complete len:218 (-) Transcript_77072:745-1398(-)